MVDEVICPKTRLHSKREPIVIRQNFDDVEALYDAQKSVKVLSYLSIFIHLFISCYVI